MIVLVRGGGLYRGTVGVGEVPGGGDGELSGGGDGGLSVAVGGSGQENVICFTCYNSFSVRDFL